MVIIYIFFIWLNDLVRIGDNDQGEVVNLNNQNRLQELIEKGKKTQLNQSELLEMISILGPEKAVRAVKGK